MSSSGRFADSTRPDDLRQVQRKRGRPAGGPLRQRCRAVLGPIQARGTGPPHRVRTSPSAGRHRPRRGCLRRMLIGRRIATEREIHERIGPFKGLAVFASDNISSSAYATEEIMRVLVFAGAGALVLTMPLTIAIVVLLAIVVTATSRRSGPIPRRRLVHRRQRQPRSRPGTDCRRGDPHRLRVDRRRLDRRRSGRTHVDLSRCSINAWRSASSSSPCCGSAIFEASASARSSSPIPTYVYLLAIFGLLAFGLWHAATAACLTTLRLPGARNHGVGQALGLLLIFRASRRDPSL